MPELSAEKPSSETLSLENRGQFSSKIGFLMAAVGSAVGLGNIWGFPTQAASNGGAAFVLAYLVLAFLLAYPALMAELVIGRHARANIVTALDELGQTPISKRLGRGVGADPPGARSAAQDRCFRCG